MKFSRTVVSTPALVLLLVVTTFAAIFFLSRRQALESLRLETSHAAEQVALRVRERLAARFGAVEVLREDLVVGRVRRKADFRSAASSVIRSFPGFQALNWIDENGIIQWVVPEADNREACGADLRKHPLAAPLLRRAEQTGHGIVTPPIELLQGGDGIAAYVPVRPGEREAGCFNVVFRLEQLVLPCVTDSIRESFVFWVHDGDSLVEASAGNPGEPPRAHVDASIAIPCSTVSGFSLFTHAPRWRQFRPGVRQVRSFSASVSFSPSVAPGSPGCGAAAEPR